jgi:hypothetical protein
VEGVPYRDVASRREEPLKHETLHLGEGPARLEGEASTWSCSASARYIVCSEHRYSPSSRTDRPRNVQRLIAPELVVGQCGEVQRPDPEPVTSELRLGVLDNAAVQTESSVMTLKTCEIPRARGA